MMVTKMMMITVLSQGFFDVDMLKINCKNALEASKWGGQKADKMYKPVATEKRFILQDAKIA